MAHRYNLRHQPSPNYRESEEEEEGEAEGESYEGESYEGESYEEEPRTSQEWQDHNTSHRSASETSHLDYTKNNSSGLSSTVSDSFSFHSGPFSTTRPERGHMYPDISPLDRDQQSGQQKEQDRSPLLTRRRTTKTQAPEAERSPRFHPENNSADRTSGRLYPQLSAPPRRQPVEYTYFGKTGGYWLSILGIICIIVLLVWLVANKESTPDFPAEPEEEVRDFDEFSKQVDGLKKQFPNQSQRFWKVVKSCTKHVFDPEQATYPAVLLMVAEKKHAHLASHIAEAIRQEFESIKLKSSSQARELSLNLTTSVGNMYVNQQKVFLDEWLRKRLDNNQVAVVVNHLESLLPESALLLHGYCDGDNAPYKEVMLIFGLFLDQSVDTPREAEDVLRSLWTTEFMKDKIGALLSRVANNIILVNGPSPGHEMN